MGRFLKSIFNTATIATILVIVFEVRHIMFLCKSLLLLGARLRRTRQWITQAISSKENKFQNCEARGVEICC
jgi:hypothetical protein